MRRAYGVDEPLGGEEDEDRARVETRGMEEEDDEVDDAAAVAEWERVEQAQQHLHLQDRRLALARDLHEHRERELRELHETKSRHYMDNLFSLLTGNMGIVCWIIGGLYVQRPCDRPLAMFLGVMGFLTPFAACLPILVRQWFYLHLRLKNPITLGILVGSTFYVLWLLVGQQWAFSSSAKTCDDELSTAANAIVFLLYLTSLLYAAKVVWYLALRVRYSYRELLLSCFRDPYPNILRVSDEEFESLDHELRSPDEGPKKDRTTRHQRLLQQLQHHQHDIRQTLHRILQSSKAPSPSAKAAVPKQRGAKVVNSSKLGTLAEMRPHPTTSQTTRKAMGRGPIPRPTSSTAAAAAQATTTTTTTTTKSTTMIERFEADD